MVQRPTSVTRAVMLTWLLVLLALALTVLAVIFDDELLRASGAAGTSADDTRVPPSFTPVVIVLYVTVVSLVLVLLSFVVGGHNWARHCLTATFGVVALATIAAVRLDPPLVFVAVGLVSFVLEGLLVYHLYRPETAAYVAPTPRPRPAARES